METYEKLREFNHSNVEIYSIISIDERLILGSFETILVSDFLIIIKDKI